MNVELLTIDKRTFTTDEGNSLQTLFGENSEGSAQYRAEVSTMAARLATVFASLKVCMQGLSPDVSSCVLFTAGSFGYM